MKGFKKDGKFVPTGNKKPSSLSSKDLEKYKGKKDWHGNSYAEEKKLREKESLEEPKMTFGEFLKSGHYLEGEIKERAKKGSPHWFDDDSMRFFSSRVTNLMWEKDDDIYFVSSEENKGFGEFRGTPRAYTVRVVDVGGDINDVGGFQAYSTVNQARHAIQDIIEGNEQ